MVQVIISNPRLGLIFLLHTYLMRGKQPRTQHCRTQSMAATPQRLCPRHLPQDCLLVYLLQHGTDVRVAAIKKMQRLRIFQIDQAMRITKEFSPFRAAFSALRATYLHQSLKVSSSKVGAKCCRSALPRTIVHTCLAKTQDVRICWTVSSSWSQRRYLFGCWRPR